MNKKGFFAAVSIVMALAISQAVTLFSVRAEGFHTPPVSVLSAPPADMFQWPWPLGKEWQITGGPHGTNGSGIDANPYYEPWGKDTSGWEVVAAADGTVTGVSRCWVQITHADGWQTEYVHLMDVKVSRDDWVSRNQTLGIVANTFDKAKCGGPDPTGPHVHLRLQKDGTPVSITGATFAGWTIGMNGSKSTYTKNGETRYIYEKLLNEMTAPVPVSCPGTIQGWKGEYWTNTSLTGDPLLCRDDSEINFQWDRGSPGSPIPSDGFSARFTRMFHFDSGKYTFYLAGDDGIRLWVDDNLLIDEWKAQSVVEYSQSIDLSTGFHTIRVEYFEKDGKASVALRWVSTPSTNYYSLKAGHSGLCLDVYGAYNRNGTQLIQWDCHFQNNQWFDMASLGDDYFKLVARHSGMCLDIAGDSRSMGAQVIQFPCHGGDNQAFRRESINGKIRLVAKHSGMCLDVEGASKDGGAHVIQWPCHANGNQQWELVQLSSDMVVLDGDPAVELVPFEPEPGLTQAMLIEYTLNEGETLDIVGEIYNVSVEAILAANPYLVDAKSALPGSTILVPVSIQLEPYQTYSNPIFLPLIKK